MSSKTVGKRRYALLLFDTNGHKVTKACDLPENFGVILLFIYY